MGNFKYVKLKLEFTLEIKLFLRSFSLVYFEMSHWEHFDTK